ncbi:MAG: hypothetical protein N3G21_03660 [Candidatus Hydrogenedentes bacterium]|nr:hypothetical protein [Candidatus Hydrogenedentota bacterium]
MKIMQLIYILIPVLTQTSEFTLNNTPQDFFYTCFQTSEGFDPTIDIGSDIAIVYGTSPKLQEKVESWRREGYRVSYMTGISWGNYESYYITSEGLKIDEIQTDKSGKVWMHGDSKTVGYNVPTDSYIEFIKREILTPPLNLRVEHIFLEEPEFWAVTGWSNAFKRIWKDYYQEEWLPPDTSIESQYKASLLKYHLYTKALRETMQFVKTHNTEEHTYGCYVPTHTLINYAQWRIVSPESMLTKIPECDGIIAQVWTGTARTPHHFRGILKERTFESAYIEYAQSVGMVAPTKKHLVFLADPIEDNPNRDWNDYRENYEATVTASLFFPEVYSYEVMPWPSRIFRGEYPKSKEEKNIKIRIPKDYGSEILTVINALNYMKQESVEWISGDYPIGMLVSDTLMFQRAEPHPSDAQLNCLFGIATPLVKNGIPLKIIQMENLLEYPVLEGIKLLLLTYEGQKPLKEDYHYKLKEWINGGGCLIIFDETNDPYNKLDQWWRKKGFSNPIEHLVYTALGTTQLTNEPENAGNGWIWWIKENPSGLARSTDGADKVLSYVKRMALLVGMELNYKNYLHLRRGAYHICSVMNESISDKPYILKGKFINLFDPELKIKETITLGPSTRALLLDLSIVRETTSPPSIIVSSGRIRQESKTEKGYSFFVRGPKDIPGKILVYLDRRPASVSSTEISQFSHSYDEENQLLIIEFCHLGKAIPFDITLQ